MIYCQRADADIPYMLNTNFTNTTNARIVDSRGPPDENNFVATMTKTRTYSCAGLTEA